MINRSSMPIALSFLLLVAAASEVRAQCATYPTPTVAYQPVVAYQPAIVQPRTGWYPGRLLDRLRLRRWGASTATPTYTAAYAPYNAYSASYTPYVTAYAPLTRTVAYQTAYHPAACGCGTCASCTHTVARPVMLQPVCNTCNIGSTGVSQAVYSEPSSFCSSCAAGASSTIYSDSAITGATTPTPELPTDETAPIQSNYPPTEKKIDPKPEAESDDPSALLRAPRLFSPGNDRAASRSRVNRPSVDVWNAVYRGPVATSPVSHSRRTQAEIDADGWEAVGR